MTYTYRYTGSVPTVFISLVKDGHTWVPNYGDTITTSVPVHHPWLELIDTSEDAEAETLAVVELTEVSVPDAHDKKSTVPAMPEIEKPATAASEGAD